MSKRNDLFDLVWVVAFALGVGAVGAVVVEVIWNLLVKQPHIGFWPAYLAVLLVSFAGLAVMVRFDR